MYGSYLHDGLGEIPGARYAGESLKIPKPAPFTGTAQGGTTMALYGAMPKIQDKLFGRTPLWEVEGQQVDPFYDVRGNSGLGQVSVLYEKPGSLPSGRDRIASARERGTVELEAPEAPAPAPMWRSGLMLVGLALAAVAIVSPGSLRKLRELV